ncbi:MAG: hypothetical protein ACRD6B_21290 [Bryobacteraceae bacterium]
MKYVNDTNPACSHGVDRTVHFAKELKSTAGTLVMPAHEGCSSKYRQSRFTPRDDQWLLRSSSPEELQATIHALAAEAHYSERAVKRHAQKLGIWDKLVSPRRQITVKERMAIKAILRFSNSKEELLAKVAGKLGIAIEDARRLLYRDPTLKESLIEGTYSLREVADGLCMRPFRIKQIVEEGKLRAKRLKKVGKLFITSDSISDFVRKEPRRIDWNRCLKKSPWLNDILESAREDELALLLCVSKRKIQSWIENGFLSLSFDPSRIGDFFGDEPVYRFLDEYPELIDVAKCAGESPEWFARYARVRGRYRKKNTEADSGRYSDRESRYYLALDRRR